jgi:xylose dehydrogenase (NAD/NADP)
MQPARLRWGVLGAARIADVLVRAFRKSNNGELAGVASRDLQRAQLWARERDIPHAFGSYDEMLASDLVDAVYIPLPNALHKEWSIRAAQSGKHVLCEKPVATSAAEVQEMIAAADANRVKMMEAFMYRFHPQIERVRQLMASGAIGEVKMVRATFGFYLDRPNDVRWMRELGGGALMDVGCYCVNVVRLLMGAEPAAASASAVWAATGVDESLAGVLEFPSGVLGSIDCSMQVGPRMQQRLTVSGTRGLIELADPFRVTEEPVVIAIDRAGEIETVEVPGADEYHLMVEHFADAVLNDQPLRYSLQESLGNMRAIEGLYEAARTGRRVVVAA